MFCFAAYMAVRTRYPVTRDMLAYCRRQAAIDSQLPWNTLIPGLQAVTLSGPSLSRGGTLCIICREPDHITSQCALAIMQQPLLNVKSSSPRYPACPLRRPESSQNICASWNTGPCSFPGVCTYKHECAVCHLGHKGITCLSAPEGCLYHRLQMANRSATVRKVPTPTS